MKYVKVSNFVDIASAAFLNVVNDIYDKIYYSDQEKIPIDITDPRSKKLFEYYLNEEIRKTKRGYGEVRILVNTCKPWDNWRKEIRGSAIRATKFNVVDQSILINNRKLETFLDQYWNRCQIDPGIHYLSHSEVDAFDYEIVITKLIGKSFVKLPNHRFLTISDSNSEYIRGLQDSIPGYLYTEVESNFRELNLIN
jgi:hypothetical protein